MLGKKHSDATKKHWSEIRKGRKMPELQRLKLIGRTPWNKGLTKEDPRVAKYCKDNKNRKTLLGKHHSEETKRKMSLLRMGKNSGFWKGGITKLSESIRSLPEYLQWRSSVYTRDNWTCQTCHNRGLEIQAHHIKSFKRILEENKIDSVDKAKQCEELWNIDNGITLCMDCHKETDTYLERWKN